MDKISTAVLIPGKVNDGSWAEAAVNAVKSLRQLGCRLVAVPQPNLPSSRIIEVTNSLAESGTELIIGHGHEYIEAFLKLALKYPETAFFAMDKLTGEQSWPVNFGCLYQRQDEATYLCGWLSAQLTKSGKVGFLGGKEVPTQIQNARAFERGVHNHRSSIEVFVNFAGSFEDPQRGRKLARDMIGEGADILMHTASETGNGLLEECERQGVYVIGYILDQRERAPVWIVTSLIVDVESIYQQKIHEVASNDFLPGIWKVGLAEGMVYLAALSDHVPDSVCADMAQTRRKIIEGNIEI